ncbi:putative membrane protein AbrB (regulator of aidB expression) [Staphylococcus caledonicus]|uniref:hypothetical protein n=1 Tax=Staphylococcus TaxID=1279 RepID=UPI000D1C7550|nr:MULTISPECIES: hypothetical protein [Staphylococcus]MBI5972686.1 hypothetical protein [Staphylococcus caledonicus]MCI2947722.1 hypothetical protein [Staphylococcus sp. acrmy]PTE68326.1 hypothetical protein BUY46_08090 [Staphylococcus devriesei]
MTIFLIVGILIPIIYVLRLNIKQHTIRIKETLITIGLSVVGITIFSLLGVLVSHQQVNILSLIVASIVVGIIWGLLLAGVYKLYNYLSHTFRK